MVLADRTFFFKTLKKTNIDNIYTILVNNCKIRNANIQKRKIFSM